MSQAIVRQQQRAIQPLRSSGELLEQSLIWRLL
jgi:hypothetical protein